MRRYLGSVMGLNTATTSPIENSPEPQSPMMKRMSRQFSTLLDSRKVTPSKTSLSLNEPVNNTCGVCNEKLAGKTVRLPDSLNKYHWACLKCKGCNKPFEDTSFFIDSTKQVYHRSVSCII